MLGKWRLSIVFHQLFQPKGKIEQNGVRTAFNSVLIKLQGFEV
jgi:hypothetical protein